MEFNQKNNHPFQLIEQRLKLLKHSVQRNKLLMKRKKKLKRQLLLLMM